jgi:transposase InsO family protein
MPWEERNAMDQRVCFIAEWLKLDYTKKELCAAYGISRPTGDKWIKRYEQEGSAGLKERSRAPHSHPATVAAAIRETIIETKLRRQSWGPKKVMDWLRRNHPEGAWPADSTAGEILRRAGLVKRRSRRRRVVPYTKPFGNCKEANASWSADFKGDFRLTNGQRCYPLTISDNYSRYVLMCRALSRTTGDEVRPWFEWVFREYGLPEAIRTDNGPPFASLGLGGVTRLSAWWIRLGIRPERIKPGTPSQNGRHERMHRSLGSGVHPIQHTLAAQQGQFDRWLAEFNWERSHEALDRQTPGSVYGSSPRPYPAILPALEYNSGMVVRQVRHNGEIKWRGRLLYLSETLRQEAIGLKQVDERQWEIYYGFHLLGYLDDGDYKITSPKQWHGET